VPAKRFAQVPLRRRIQMVFQDPTDSLNPRFTAARAIADPILQLGDIRGSKAVRARCEELALQVGLPLEFLDRFPHQLSGGQKARVGIARAIALNPALVILDEPTAALDVSVQAVVLNLLQELKERLGMSYLFVSHDLHVVRLLCDRVIVMRSGTIVEQGPTERVMTAPEADYTRELLSAVPHPPVLVSCWLGREERRPNVATVCVGSSLRSTQPTEEPRCLTKTPTSIPSSAPHPRRWNCPSSPSGSRR
jgi:peptide/nickel transport system ATP-binding protein